MHNNSCSLHKPASNKREALILIGESCPIIHFAGIFKVVDVKYRRVGNGPPNVKHGMQ